MPHAIYWNGMIPKECDVCLCDIVQVFYDMKTTRGPWGCLCRHCAYLGPGIGRLGTGYGQKYEKQADGRWLKTEG